MTAPTILIGALEETKVDKMEKKKKKVDKMHSYLLELTLRAYHDNSPAIPIWY